MTKRESDIGVAMAIELSSAIERLSFAEMMALRNLRGKPWADYPASIQRKCADLGIAFLKRLPKT